MWVRLRVDGLVTHEARVGQGFSEETGGHLETAPSIHSVHGIHEVVGSGKSVERAKEESEEVTGI